MTTEEIIKSRFVTPKHFDAISNVILETRHTGCGKLNVIISFREAGEHTIKMLSAGAGAKPYSILAKSIKDGTLSEKDKTVTGMDKLYGLVPTRDEEGVNGLYLTSLGETKFREMPNPAYMINKENGHPVLKSAGSMENFIAEITAIKNFAQYFITGDYDVHDLISLTGQRHPVPSDSREEREILIRLNDAMREKNTWSILGQSAAIPVWQPDEYDLIQHGPQYNYIVYEYNNEKNVKIQEKVARIDTPVAICSPKGWLIKNTPQELVQYYKDNSIKVKELWQLSEAGEAYLAQCKDRSFQDYMNDLRRKK